MEIIPYKVCMDGNICAILRKLSFLYSKPQWFTNCMIQQCTAPEDPIEKIQAGLTQH